MSHEENIVIDDAAVDRRMREKADSRRRDAARLASGEVTPEELQRENSMIPKGWAVKAGIPDLYKNVGRS